MEERFADFARRSANAVGSPYAFSAGAALVVVWALSGFFFRFSDTWQLFINTLTTISTGLTVFLIQNAQNRDSRAIHLKLDEIICALEAANNDAIELEQKPLNALSDIQEQHHRMQE